MNLIYADVLKLQLPALEQLSPQLSLNQCRSYRELSNFLLNHIVMVEVAFLAVSEKINYFL